MACQNYNIIDDKVNVHFIVSLGLMQFGKLICDVDVLTPAVGKTVLYSDGQRQHHGWTPGPIKHISCRLLVKD